ncbi:MAG: NIPSNAP family protein [Beijerinckiaceae bacterium]|nr:NIPSNAP family protein [Beijerinckiaceae bacterium]
MAIVEERTYTIRTGLVQDYLALYEREGAATHWKHLGPPVGWFSSEIGALNQVVMIWRYESHADREQKRAKLMADPDWLAFLPKTRPFIERMENRILVPTAFSPLQ